MIRVASIAPHEDYCGISHYANLLEQAMRLAGARVDTLEIAQLPVTGLNPQGYDGLVIHSEFGTDGKSARIAGIFATLLKSRVPRRSRIVVLHSIFRAHELRFSKPVRTAAIVYQWVAFRLLGRLARLAVFTESGAAELRAHGISPELLPFGMYALNGSADNRGTATSESVARVGIVGHPYSAKRYDLAARAFCALPPHVRAEARFCVVGGEAQRDPAAWDAIESALSELPASQVEITGPLDDEQFGERVEELDVVLLPYNSRNSGSAVLAELLGRGVAIIASNANIFAEAATAGALLTVEDWEEQAPAVLAELLTNTARRQELKDAAARFAQRNSIRHVGEKLVASFA